MHVLVTGGAGYIGSHVVHALRRAGHFAVVFDNLSTGHCEAVPAGTPLVKGDIRNRDLLIQVMGQYAITSVLHLAALSEVGESVVQPAKYYDTNVVGSLSLLSAMKQIGVTNIVFSSSASIYEAASGPIHEEAHKKPVSPYSFTKYAVERVLADFAQSDGFSCVSFR